MNEKGFNFPIQLSVCEKKTLVMNSELKMEDIVHSSLKKLSKALIVYACYKNQLTNNKQKIKYFPK